ncbi:insecticidal crystal toxin P42 protein [Saccharothrix saharensis]|uniref:Insecticidal crystal toxin P42 protein n=1 Tax=Saccharothrix saharensis TaxID=571190 RepID=A0A543J7J1_9PSEU|nr:hypothetical protein [Saccharothrix saharensis]TQM78772.1 insecticidal crystal toxin P42 protein [Saccharothrix saharensis]
MATSHWAMEFGDKLLSTGASYAAFLVVKPPLYPVDDTDEHLDLPTGAFTYARLDGGSDPGPTPVTYVLDLPAVPTKSPGPDKPESTSYQEPADQPVVTDRAFTVPYVMVEDDDRSEKWKVDKSPFRTLTRQRTYHRIFRHDNRQGSVAQHDGRQVTTGVTKDSSRTFGTRTGVTVGQRLPRTRLRTPLRGVGHGGGHQDRDLYTAPHSCGALWLEQHKLFPARGDGSLVGGDAVLDFDVDNAVTGEYPPEAGVRHTERLVTTDAADVEVPVSRPSPTDSPAGAAPRPPS